MAAGRVFVDDAVLGELPPVCVKTGEPADLVVASTRPVGGLGGAWWLLLLLGPAGFLALVVIALVGQEQLTVQVPYTRAAWDADRQLRKRAWTTVGMGLGSLLLAIVFRSLFPLMWAVAGVVLLVAGLTMWGVASSRQVGISLDGSRRWVTFWCVHPDFVRAVQDRDAATTAAGR